MTLALHGFPDWQNSLETADLQATLQSRVYTHLDGDILGPLDMRKFSSYTVTVDAQCGVPMTNRGRVEICAEWVDSAAGTHILFQDWYQIFPRSNGGGVSNNLIGGFQLQDAVHGPWLNLQIQNIGAESITVTTVVTGNSRSLPRRYVGGFINDGSITVGSYRMLLLTSGAFTGAGANQDFYMPIAPGPCQIRLASGTASTMSYSIITPETAQVYQISHAAGQADEHTIALPSTACVFNVANTGGANNNMLVQVMSHGVWL